MDVGTVPQLRLALLVQFFFKTPAPQTNFCILLPTFAEARRLYAAAFGKTETAIFTP